jgi:DNA-binding transcriptional LysR family regulator
VYQIAKRRLDALPEDGVSCGDRFERVDQPLERPIRHLKAIDEDPALTPEAALGELAAHGSFSAAGAQLRLSQRSVSARIAAVERTIGTPLFLRDSRGARLTAAGERYLGYVRRSLALLEDGQRAASAEPTPAVLRVGIPASYAAALAPGLTDAAIACAVSLALHASHSRELRTDLRDGRIDVALVTAGIVPIGLTSRHALTTDTIALAAPGVRADPTDTRYAVHSWSEASEEIISHLLGRGVPRTNINVVSPAAAAISLAIHRGHIAVVPRLTAQLDIDNGRLQLLDLSLPNLTIGLDWLHRSVLPAGSLERFIHEAETAGRVRGNSK